MLYIPQGLALDIDETLSITGIRMIEALQKRFGCPENLTAKELMEKYRHTSNIPYWNTPEHHIWKLQLIETEELYEDLDVIEKANHIVEKIQAIIPIACYLTARPEGTTEVSKRWLKRHNFPDSPVISKPNSVSYEDSNKWKAKLLTEYHPNTIGIVDDNPGIIKALPQDYKGTVFLYSHPSYNIETPLNVIACETWDHVYEKITSLHPQSQP